MYERTKEGNPNANPPADTVTDTIVKYNNKAPNTAQAYTAYFNDLTANMAGDAVTSIVAATGVIELDEQDIAENHGLFMGDFGITGPHQTIPAPMDDTETIVDEETVNVAGSFRGISGTFTCESECTRSSDKDSNLSGLGGAWVFTPSGTDTDGTATMPEVEALRVQGVIPDPDFMLLGYWLQATTDADGETEYAMRPFAYGNRDFGTVESVEGSARYEGPATGLYMRKVFTVADDGSGTTATPVASGQFTADAVLTATFGQIMSGDNMDSIAPGLFNTITGHISNFMDSDGMEIDSRWTVMLTKGMINELTALSWGMLQAMVRLMECSMVRILPKTIQTLLMLMSRSLHQSLHQAHSMVILRMATQEVPLLLIGNKEASVLD